MFSLYLDPAHFGASDFAAKAAEYARYVKASRPEIAGAEVLVPGETEARMRADRLANGVPLQVDTWQALVALGRSLGVDAPN
jgi:uncharacterized oxidoreductase